MNIAAARRGRRWLDRSNPQEILEWRLMKLARRPLQDWKNTIEELGTFAFDHLWSTDNWFRKLSEQAVEICGLEYCLIPEDEYAHYLRKKMRELPEPYITHEQLSLILGCSSVVRDRTKYKTILDLYRKHFLAEGLSSVPRPLKHLCRCAVRETLKSRHNLPDGVEELPLPTTLKDYVNLKED